MKKTLTIIVLLGLCFMTVKSQTVISDKQEVSGSWKKSGSPYIIKGEAIVPKGATLKIEKGVEVRFKTGYEDEYFRNENFDRGFLRVSGTLIAKGTKKKPILFTSNSDSGKWGTIFFQTKSKDSKLEYCIVQYSHYIRSILSSDNSTGAITFYNCSGTIQNCVIKESWSGINCKNNATPLIKNCTIVQNQYGIECNSASNAQIENSIIWKNETTFFINGGSMPTISHSLIEGALDPAINDGGKNITNDNPGIKDINNNNFKLNSDSPCKGAGKNGKNIGAEF